MLIASKVTTKNCRDIPSMSITPAFVLILISQSELFGRLKVKTEEAKCSELNLFGGINNDLLR